MAEIAPIDPSKPSPAITRMGSDIARDEQLYTRRSSDLAAKSETNAAEREKVLAPMEADLQARMAEPTPQREKVDIPQFKPEPIIDAKDYEALSYGLIAMAMIGGVASKGKWLEVGSVLNGALSGYLEGNKIEAQKRYKDYDEQFKGAMAKEAQANREFETILKDRHMRIGDQINAYRIVAAKYDRQDALAAAQSRSLDRMWQSIESRKTAMTRLEEAHERATEKIRVSQGGTGLSEKYTSDPAYKKNVDYWAKYLQMGNSLPPRFAQSGAGKQMMPDILNVVPTMGGGNPADMMANKLSQREMTAEAQKLGTQAASVAIANAELERFIPAAEKAVDNVPRSSFRPLNKLLEAGQNTWSPEQGQFVIAHRAVLNAFSQLIQRGAPTVHSLTEAEALLSTADSPTVYKAKMKQLKIEGEQAEAGLQDARDALLKRARNIGGGPAGAAGPQPGHVEGGYKFKGGDPADQSNWEKQ